MDVDFQCIKKTRLDPNQYTQTRRGELDNLGIPYLCNSIMHYEEYGDPGCPILKKKKGLKCKDGKVGLINKLLPEDWTMIYIAHCCKHKNKYKSCWKRKEQGRCNAQKWGRAEWLRAKRMRVKCAQSCKCTNESYIYDFLYKKHNITKTK